MYLDPVRTFHETSVLDYRWAKRSESKFCLRLLSIYSIATIIVHGLGIITAAHAVMVVRSSRGEIAWGISLITFPWLAIPLYWILGKNEFQEYAEALQKAYLEKHNLVRRFIYSIQTMLQNDLDSSVLVNLNAYQKKPLWFKLTARVSRLLAPIL